MDRSLMGTSRRWTLSAWTRRAASLGLAATLVFAFAFTALGAPLRDKTVEVDRRDGALTVRPNGDLQVVETWQVNFMGGPFTYAFRAIPRSRLAGISDWAVSGDGQPYRASNKGEDQTFSVSDAGESYTLTWHFPPTNRGSAFWSDRHTFVLTYTVAGALRIYPEGDQIWWKFVESDRNYPIQAARVVLHLPESFDPSRLQVATYVGDTDTRMATVVDGSTVEFTGGPFPPKTEWEIRAQFPHGAVAAEPSGWQVAEDQLEARVAANNLLALNASVLILIGGLLGLYLLWYLRGRDRPAGMVAEHLSQPPEALGPGQAGTLLDEHADLQDVVATLVDLARRGYLSIVEGFDLKFVRGAADRASLHPYEQVLLGILLGDRTERSLSEVRGDLALQVELVQDALYQGLVKEGYFAENPRETERTYLRAGVTLLAVVGIGGLVWYLTVQSVAPFAVLPVIAASVIAACLVWISRYMPKKTDMGSIAAAKWRAFRRYLANIEKYRDVAAARDQFENYLPYAIAFGLEKSWVEKFAQVNTPAPTWYLPERSFVFGPSLDGELRSHRDSQARPPQSGSLPHLGSETSGGAAAGATEGLPPPGAALDRLSTGALGGLDGISSQFFSMLDSAASAFSTPPARASSGSSGGFWDGLLGWLAGGSASSDDSSSSRSAYRSSSSSHQSSSRGWSGGGSRGGRGGGGGSSGFG